MKKVINEKIIKQIVSETIMNLLNEDNSLWDFNDEENTKPKFKPDRFGHDSFKNTGKDSEENYMWQQYGNQNIDTSTEPGWAGMASLSQDRNERAFGRAVRSTAKETDNMLRGEENLNDF